MCFRSLGLADRAGKLASYLPDPRGRWQHILVVILGFVGLAIAIVGVWRLSVARDRRWDVRGVVALCLMLVPGLPTLFLLLFLVVVLLSPSGRMFGD